jgi:hypothetical protein
VTEIDWHKVHVARLAACCQRAAADLNLSITSPFILNAGEREEHRFVALFPRIGPLNGTLVCLAADWEKLSDIAHTYGYSCVGVLPESCASYDPAKWAAFIKEWDAPPTDA